MARDRDIAPSATDDENSDRRDPAGGRTGDRRRFKDFRRAYPGFVFTLVIGLIAMLAFDGFLIMKRRSYEAEVGRLRANMSEQERAKTDAIVAAEHNKAQIAIELARRQAKLAEKLHLSVTIDSGKIYLERQGAVLREMAAAFGPEIKSGPNSIPVVIPRGETSIAKATADGITLDGGTIIAPSDASSLAQDARPIPPGSVRISRKDLKAILPNLSVGMRVYFY